MCFRFKRGKVVRSFPIYREGGASQKWLGLPIMSFNDQNGESLPFRSFPIYREGGQDSSGSPSR
jgi:hypothetical protein